MRIGAEFVTSPEVRVTHIDLIVNELELCSEEFAGCDDCPDIKVCTKAYDARCDIVTRCCKVCGETVPANKYCCNCGSKLVRKRKRRKNDKRGTNRISGTTGQAEDATADAGATGL
jgi:hypothetical protein